MIVEFDLQQRSALLLQFTRGEGHRFRRADADGLRHTDMRRGRHAAEMPQALPVQAALEIPQRRIQRVAGGARRHLYQQLFAGHALCDRRRHLCQLCHHRLLAFAVARVRRTLTDAAHVLLFDFDHHHPGFGAAAARNHEGGMQRRASG